MQPRSREDDLQLLDLSRLAAQSKQGLPETSSCFPSFTAPLQRHGGGCFIPIRWRGTSSECSPTDARASSVPPACQGARRAPSFFSCFINGPCVSFTWPRPGVHVHVHGKMNSSARGLNCFSFSSSSSSCYWCRIASLAQASSFLQTSWDFFLLIRCSI